MMDIGANVRRIKDNLLLIPEARFDGLTKDPDYKDSFVYLAACLVLAMPVDLIVSLASGTFLASLVMLPVTLIAGVIFAYVFYGIQFLLLRLLGGQASFLQSVQIFIYGSTVALIFGGIPCLGSILALVALANIVLGSARIHKISIARALIALVAIPIILVIIIVVAIAFVGALGYFTVLSTPLPRPL